MSHGAAKKRKKEMNPNRTPRLSSKRREKIPKPPKNPPKKPNKKSKNSKMAMRRHINDCLKCKD